MTSSVSAIEKIRSLLQVLVTMGIEKQRGYREYCD